MRLNPLRTRALLPALLAVCGLAQAQTAQIVVAQPADVRSTNPGVNRDNTTDGVVLNMVEGLVGYHQNCLLYTSPSPRDRQKSRMPSSA